MVDEHDAWLRDELYRRHFWVASKDPESDVELPLRILVLGDLTQRPDPRPLAARRPVVITRDTFDPVLAEQALTLELTVPDLLSPEPGGPMRVQLSFKRLKDFTPEGIARQVPALDDLLELRSAVSAIRGPLGPIPSFVKRLRAVVQEEDSRQQLRRELSAPRRAPADQSHDETLIGDLLVEAHCGPQEEGHRVVRRGLEALLAAALSPRYAGQVPNRDLANQVLDEIDGRLSAQVRALMHHPAFVRLEAAWRTLRLLVDAIDPQENIVLEALHCTLDDLRDDFEDALDLRQSALFQHVHDAVVAAPALRPYGLLVADFELGPSRDDLWLLRRCGAVAAAVHVPFLAAGAPTLLDAEANAQWQAFRACDEARYVGLCLPRFVLRPRYGDTTVPVKSFRFEEVIDDDDPHALWGNASAAMATTLAARFAQYRWWPTLPDAPSGPGDALIVGASSTAELSSLLCACRVAHHLQRAAQEGPDATDAAGVQRALAAWLHQFTAADDQVSLGLRRRRPFREASVVVEEHPGPLWRYRFYLRVTLHRTPSGEAPTLSLTGGLGA